MNAVNNGPIKAKNIQSRGNFEAYRNLEIPYARNHDASFCSAYGGEHTVDVHAIFPDFSKDPNDPASYDFARTDRYLKTIMEAGSKVFYRLGSKIEHAPEKYGTKVPSDFKKMGNGLRAHHPPLQRRLGERVQNEHRILGNLERT